MSHSRTEVDITKLIVMRYCLSVDWFQAFCKLTKPIARDMGTYFNGRGCSPAGYVPVYEVRPCKERHALFAQSMSIYLRKMPLLHIHWHPRSSVIARDAVAVKVANRALYCSSWGWYLRDVMAVLGLRYVSLTRVDICADFQRFADDLDPRLFIARYLADGSVSDDVQYIRRGSNLYHITGRKRHKPISKEDCPDGTAVPFRTMSCHEYLRFGTRRSGVSAYLYNKSLELMEGKHKPYISKLWEDSGLIEDPTAPVFRLEFSIQSKGMTVERRGTKQVLQKLGLRNLSVLQIEDFASPTKLADVYFAYASKYWKFKRVTGAKYVKDMPDVSLFDANVTPSMVPRDISRALDCGRAELNAASCLERLQVELPDLDTSMAQSLHEASKTLLRIGLIKQTVFNETIPDEGWLFRPRSEPWRLLMANYKTRPVHQDHLARLIGREVARRTWKTVETIFGNEP